MEKDGSQAACHWPFVLSLQLKAIRRADKWILIKLTYLGEQPG